MRGKPASTGRTPSAMASPPPLLPRAAVVPPGAPPPLLSTSRAAVRCRRLEAQDGSGSDGDYLEQSLCSSSTYVVTNPSVTPLFFSIRQERTVRARDQEIVGQQKSNSERARTVHGQRNQEEQLTASSLFPSR